MGLPDRQNPMMPIVKITVLLCASLALIACGSHVLNSGRSQVPEKAEGMLRLASMNVHYIILSKEQGPWSVADWERRKKPMDAAFKAIAPDVMGFQEMESFARSDASGVNLTLDYLLEQNPDYAAGAVGDWQEFPSTQPILYRKDRFNLLDQGWFFFSDTPDVIYSRTFNGSYPAFASWVKLQGADGAFYVFNVHFEYKSRSNRLKSAALVASRIAPLIAKSEKVLLVGDTNARAGARTMKVLEAPGLRFALSKGATYHLNKGLNLFSAIDHIGTSEGISIEGNAGILRQKFFNEWPSDHYPIYVDARLN